MKISKIYEKYKIMHQLQLHMLRVAGVASIICDNFIKRVDKNLIISACLLHDLGDIIKFDFDSGLFAESWFAPQGKAYWRKIQQKFILKYGIKYGKDANLANYRISREIGAPEKVSRIIQLLGFKTTGFIHQTDDYNLKICEYSDMRVKPTGVTSLKERLEEGMNRYKTTLKNRGYSQEKLKRIS